MPPAPLLFDFDGTLIDSAPDIRTAANQMLDTLGLAPLTLAQIHGFVGDGARALVARCLQAAGGTASDTPAAEDDALARLTARYMAIYSAIRPDPSCVYPCVDATLETLRRRGHPLALVTNKPEGATHEVLDAVGLARHFTVVVGGDTLPQRKPHPAPLLEALRRLGQPPTHAVMVGDGPNDVAAGRAAGLRVIAVSHGYAHGPVEALGADHVVATFPDLIPVLAEGVV